MWIGKIADALKKSIAKLTSTGRLNLYKKEIYAARLYGCLDFSIA